MRLDTAEAMDAGQTFYAPIPNDARSGCNVICLSGRIEPDRGGEASQDPFTLAAAVEVVS